MKRALFVILLLAGAYQVFGGTPELGTVTWEKNLDTALVKSGESGKPVFLLFQEVPG